MDAIKFGTFLVQRRKELGLTQAQLAERIHVTDKAVSRWERGIGLPDINLLEPLAEALEVSVLEVLRGEKMQDTLMPVMDAEELVSDTISLAAEQAEAILKEKEKKPILFYITTAMTCIGLMIVLQLVNRESPNALLGLIGYLMAFSSPIYLFSMATKYYVIWKSKDFSNYRNQKYQ